MREWEIKGKEEIGMMGRGGKRGERGTGTNETVQREGKR